MAMLAADRRIEQMKGVVEQQELGLKEDWTVPTRLRNVLSILYGALVEYAFSAQKCADLAAEAYVELRRVSEMLDGEK